GCQGAPAQRRLASRARIVGQASRRLGVDRAASGDRRIRNHRRLLGRTGVQLSRWRIKRAPSPPAPTRKLLGRSGYRTEMDQLLKPAGEVIAEHRASLAWRIVSVVLLGIPAGVLLTAAWSAPRDNATVLSIVGAVLIAFGAFIFSQQ